jgi:hypothetical protein
VTGALKKERMAALIKKLKVAVGDA